MSYQCKCTSSSKSGSIVALSNKYSPNCDNTCAYLGNIDNVFINFVTCFQESEIYQKCIRPPPNRTVLESESPPPYRSSSAGLLGSIGSSSSSGSSDWSGGSAPLVVRCHSMSSTSKRPEAAGPSAQKTDFIQRTVKIFTGKKSQPPPAPTLPAVIVPSRPRRTSDQQGSAGSAAPARPKPSV